MEGDRSIADSLLRLATLEPEYDMTVRVLSVLVERVQKLTGSTEIQISDVALINQPDLLAWRNPTAGFVSLKTTR